MALTWGGIRDVLAIEKHAASIRMLKTNEDAQEGRLSAARGAQYREKLSPMHVESNSMEHFAAVKGLLDSFDGELMGAVVLALMVMAISGSILSSRRIFSSTSVMPVMSAYLTSTG